MGKRGSRLSAASTASTPATASESSDLVSRLQAEVTHLRHHVSVLSRRLHDCEVERSKAWDVLHSYPPPPVPPWNSFVGLSPSPSEPAPEAVVGSSLPYTMNRMRSGSESESASISITTTVSTPGSSGPPTHPAALSRKMRKKQRRLEKRRMKADTLKPVVPEDPEGPEGEKRAVDLYLEEMEPHLCPVRKLGDGKVVWRCPCGGSFSSDRYDYVPGLRYHWAHHGCTEIKMIAVGLVDDEVPDSPLVCRYCGTLDD